MENFGIFIILAMIVFIIYLIIKRRGPMTSTDDMFSQNGVTVNYKEATISINKYTYSVGQVIGIKTVQDTNNARGGSALVGGILNAHVVIEVDDLKKPVHKIGAVGFGNAERLAQRISIALRKAGGPSFV